MEKLTIDAILRAAERLPKPSEMPVRVEMANSTFYACRFAEMPRDETLGLPVLPIRTLDVYLPHGVIETVYADGHRERKVLA